MRYAQKVTCRHMAIQGGSMPEPVLEDQEPVTKASPTTATLPNPPEPETKEDATTPRRRHLSAEERWRRFRHGDYE